MRKKIGLFTFTLVLIVCLAVVCVNRYKTQSIRINEVCGKYLKETGTENLFEDYVELYNTGILDCNMEQLYLSDDPENLKKYSLQGKLLKAKECLAIGVNHSKDGVGEFKISSQGETIYLSDEFENILDQIEVPALEDNMAYARAEDGIARWKIKTCTPGKTNEEGIAMVEAPVFSLESGFYEEEVKLELTAEENANIYYTLDGSIPDKEAKLYERPILVKDPSSQENVWNSVKNVVKEWKKYTPDDTLVDKAFIVRAVAIDENGSSSDVVTKSFFVGQDQYKEKNVLSLVTDPTDMFGKNGIHVTGKEYDEWYTNGKKGEQPIENFRKRGREWEIQGSMEYFQNNLILEQNVGVRIQGGSAREGAKKRFSLYARKEYSGDSLFGEKFFPDKKSHSVMLRDNFANVFCQDLVKEREVAIQQAIPVTLFLNGEYWYDTYIQEKYSDTYIERTYGIDKNNVVIMHDGYIEEGVESDYELYGDIYEYYSTHDFTKEESYQGFGEVIDIQSYIDFMVSNIYMCNMDVSELKNYVIWRSREKGDGKYSDGRWRWMMYDLDSVEWNDTVLDHYDVDSAAAIDSFSQEMCTAEGSYHTQGIYRTLKNNQRFSQQFVTTFMDMVNTTFSIENVGERLKEWGRDLTWEDSFFAKRPKYILPYLEKEFNLQGSLEDVTIKSNILTGGVVQINTVTPELENGEWSGQYYTDYPVVLEAKPQKGYEFVGWSGSVNSDSSKIEVSVEEGGVIVYAKFKKVEK